MVVKMGRATAWREAFDAEATEEAMAEVVKFAAPFARKIEIATRCSDDMLARELAQEAFIDTLDRVVNWEPESGIPLVAHLCQVVRSKASHELSRAKRFVHVSLERGHSTELEEDVAEAVAPDDEENSIEKRASDAMAGMRACAANDPSVLGLLDAFERGVIERAAILELTGMSPRTYENAVRRLRRHARKLAPECLAGCESVPPI